MSKPATPLKAILFDLDGVIYQAESPIPGADGVIDWVRRKDIPHLFLTNTSSRPRQAIVDKLFQMGIVVDVSELLTPAIAAADWLRTHGAGPAALFMRLATRSEFEGVPVLDEQAESGAGAVVVGDLGELWSFPTLNRAFRLLMVEPRPQLIALGMTRYWQAGDGLRLDTGPFVIALSHASGVEPRVLGKPAPAFFEAALSRLGVQGADTLMIGDDIRGDIQGAQNAGIRAMLVRTGKFRPQDLSGDTLPDAVLDSVVDLPRWWQGRAEGP